MSEWKVVLCPDKCGLQVIFAQNEVGSTKLVNATPTGGGTLELYKGPHGETRVAPLLPAKLRYGRKLWSYHKCRWGRR